MSDPLRKTKTISDLDTPAGGAGAITGTGPISRPVRGVPTHEYVAAPGALWYGPYVRALPQWIDDISRDLGNDIFERMLYDPQVAKCVNDLRCGVLENGYEIFPVEDQRELNGHQVRIGRPRRQCSPQSTEVADFCRRVLDGLDRPFNDILFEMMIALAYGNKVAEKIYEVAGSGRLAGRLVLRDLRPKAREHVAFVVDSFNNVLGIMAFVPGVAWPVAPQTVLAEPGEMPNILPRGKFAVLTHRPQNGDPRGTSILRPAYNAWWLKMQTWPELLKWEVQSAGSSLVGMLPEKAQPVQEYDGNGVAVGEPIQPAPAMLQALQQVQNGSVSVLPHGSQVQQLPVNHESGRAFAELIEVFNREIANAILGQTLATDEGRHQTRASSGTHADILSQIKRQERSMVCDFIRNEVLVPLVRLNYGDEMADLTPFPQMGATDAEDFSADATALGHIGFTVDPSQFAAIDGVLGLPIRANPPSRSAGPFLPEGEEPSPAAL